MKPIFRYAQAKGLCRDNPAGPAREILPRRKDSGRMPVLLDWVSLGDLLRRANRELNQAVIYFKNDIVQFFRIDRSRASGQIGENQ